MLLGTGFFGFCIELDFACLLRFEEIRICLKTLFCGFFIESDLCMFFEEVHICLKTLFYGLIFENRKQYGF